MDRIRVACQTYTWEMLGDRWQGQPTDLLDMIAAAGYEGVEITNTMIGPYSDHPAEFADELEQRGLCLACFAYASPSGFTIPEAHASDLEGACRAIDFLRHFPEPRLGLGGAANLSRVDIYAKLDQALALYNEVGRQAVEQGIMVNVHPHSHFGSLLESAEEYEYLLSGLNPAWVSFGPDTGHIVRGGQDLLTCLQTYLPRLTHLHLKDTTATGDWQPLGEGSCDFPAVLKLLEHAGYDGWIVAEEESAAARDDGLTAICRNREYLQRLGY